MTTVTRRRFLQLGAAATVGGSAALRAEERWDLIVVGAGLAGLNASLLAEEFGFRVLVLEGRNRVGGRLYTMDDVPGSPEAGGSGIGNSYARLLDRAQQLEVELVPERPRTEARAATTMMHIGGQPVLLEDWEASPLNPYPDDLKALPPWLVFFGHLPKLNPLGALEDWQEPDNFKWDIPLYQYLREQGFSEEGIRLLNINASYGNTVYDTSLLHIWHVFTNFRTAIGAGGPAMSVEGGNQRMPEAMAAALKEPPRLQKHVRRIEETGDRVQVRTADGGRYSARYVLLAVPFTALRLIDIDPPLQGPQAEAVATLDYHRAFQAHFAVERPFWEQDGLPPSMWTDTAVERFNALYYGPNGSISSFLMYVNGAGAGRYDRLPPEAAALYALAEYERIRPAAKGALRPIKTWSWQQTPFSGGAYASWRPGHISRFAQRLREPRGRLHFAGEHTALLQRGMEGALESGERAGLEILERLA